MGKVAVFSAGSWGTAFSIVLADADLDLAVLVSDRVIRRIDPATELVASAVRRLAVRPGRLVHPGGGHDGGDQLRQCLGHGRVYPRHY